MTRCINIDWLECYCIEPMRLDAAYFMQNGWNVKQRDYGTRVYEEMFTLLDYTTGEPLIEIRRNPVGADIGHSILDPNSCHIRLTNRTCYYDNAAEIMFDFIVRYKYTFMRISRIDICLDFEYFDSLDNPQDFVQRYLKGRYAKINQTNIRSVGKDLWDGRVWNSLSWGSPKSQISTKLYNKTLELKECKDKPYIRQAWAMAGLVDDFIKLTKTKKGEEYKPIIWRLEFSIKSSVKGWFVIEDTTAKKTKPRSIHNTLDCYFSKQQILNVFASLTEHYFHFKKVCEKPSKSIALATIRQEVDWKNRDRNLQRKDRCPDKVLFNFTDQTEFYKVERVASSKPKDKHDEVLLRKLQLYRESHYQDEIRDACTLLIHDIENTTFRKQAANPHDETELTILRQLISRRISGDKETTFEQVKALMTIFDEMNGFGEK